MTIKTQKYKTFSWDLHAMLGHRPSVAQLELTYRCPLRCRHCYTGCYNDRRSTDRDLSTRQVKTILDKCKEAGVIWFCFTGGDPLTRPDFPELYNHSKKLGFIVTIFTSLTALSQKTFETFRKSPPFCIETTLNAATLKTYRAVTVTHLFRTQLGNIKKLLNHGISVKVKTQVTRQNIQEIAAIKKLVKSLGLDFRPSTMLFACLDHDASVCSLRLDPKKSIRVNKKYGYYDEESSVRPNTKIRVKDLIQKPESAKLFTCAAGGDSYWISARGEMTICGSLKKTSYDLLKKGHTVSEGFQWLNQTIHGMTFKTQSKCRACKYRRLCSWCPARAYLETGSLEKPIDYFCDLTRETLRANGISSF